MGCSLHYSPMFFNNVFFFFGLTTFGTFIQFWLFFSKLFLSKRIIVCFRLNIGWVSARKTATRLNATHSSNQWIGPPCMNAGLTHLLNQCLGLMTISPCLTRSSRLCRHSTRPWGRSATACPRCLSASATTANRVRGTRMELIASA